MYDNTPFRERFQLLEEKEGLTLGEVAARCGWVQMKNGKERCDSSRVARQLGMVVDAGKIRTHVTEENAVLLCKALHIDPCDIPDL